MIVTMFMIPYLQLTICNICQNNYLKWNGAWQPHFDYFKLLIKQFEYAKF